MSSKVYIAGEGPGIYASRGYPGGPITGPQEGQTTVAPANPALPVSPDNIAALTPRTVPGLGDLWSLPDGTKDTYDTDGVLTRRVEGIALDGTEAWVLGGTGVRANTIDIAIPTVPLAKSCALSTHFESILDARDAVHFFAWGKWLDLFIPLSLLSAPTLDAAKAWLAAQKAADTPITVLYALAQPTTQYILTTGPIPTRSTDLGAPSWTGKSTLSGDPAPERPAAIAGVPFAATATGGGQDRAVDLGFVGYSLPDGTCDTYDGRTGELVQRVGRLVLDGSEAEWFLVRPWERNGFGITIKDAAKSHYPICTHFAGRVPDAGKFGTAYIDAGPSLLVAYDSTDLSAFKSWLAAQASAGAPVTVLYALAAPIRTTRKADLQCFDGETTITGADRVEIMDGRVERFGGYLPLEMVQQRLEYLTQADFDDLNTPTSFVGGIPRGVTGTPYAGYFNLFRQRFDAKYMVDILTDINADELKMYARNITNGLVKPWERIATAAPPQEYDLPLAEGFFSVGASHDPPVYSKDPFGRCFVTGFISGPFSVDAAVATLPAGFRPSKEVHAPCYFSGENDSPVGMGRVIVKPQGQIICLVQGEANKNALFNFSFLAAQ